jgi:hypothetical protein
MTSALKPDKRPPYIFFRKEGWYPVEGIKDDAEVIRHVELNPGTLRVEDINGRVVWRPQ